jgi:hypothetical protein
MQNIQDFDPENLKTDTKLEIHLPRLICVDDYHDLRYYQNIMQKDFGVNLIIDEVGYFDMSYIGLVHLNTPAHQDILKKAIEYYKDIDE